MLRDMLHILHLLSHPFIKHTLLWEMRETGGVQHYLACSKCGKLDEIDRYQALELLKTQEAVHIDEFYK